MIPSQAEFSQSPLLGNEGSPKEVIFPEECFPGKYPAVVPGEVLFPNRPPEVIYGCPQGSTEKSTSLPQPTPSIRQMQEEDLDQVQLIDRLSFSMPWPVNGYRYELKENPNSLQWVAEIKGSTLPNPIVGMIVVWMILEEAHIATIAVHPDWRGLGIAKKLLAAGLTGALERGAELSTLEVRANNLPAQKLYRGFKFEVVGRRPHYYKDNQEDALIMTVGRKILLSQEGGEP